MEGAPQAAPQALKNWRKILKSVLREFATHQEVLQSVCLMFPMQSMHSRISHVNEMSGTASLYAHVNMTVQSRKDPASGAPAGMPVVANPTATTPGQAMAALKKRDNCPHQPAGWKQGDPNLAMKKYSAGRHGNFAMCQLCNRKWVWNKDNNKWDLHTPSEAPLVKLANFKFLKQEVKQESKEEQQDSSSSQFGLSEASFSRFSQSSSGSLPRGARARGLAALGAAQNSSSPDMDQTQQPMDTDLPVFPDTDHPGFTFSDDDLL